MQKCLCQKHIQRITRGIKRVEFGRRILVLVLEQILGMWWWSCSVLESIKMFMPKGPRQESPRTKTNRIWKSVLASEQTWEMSWWFYSIFKDIKMFMPKRHCQESPRTKTYRIWKSFLASERILEILEWSCFILKDIEMFMSKGIEMFM